ncbi:MAG: TIGR00730 family Rossman fold protein [Oscillospiraceae bacterium]|jgi:uncharacterized protein (TIGR00730 family)
MNICIFGAASNSIDAAYLSAGHALGRELARRGHTLVFGGGAGGLMGAVASGATEAGGKSIGVVPSFLNVDGALYESCTELIYTETMRDRKQTMEECSDAFVMTPGGVGTYEEFMEILTLRHLGRHKKPIAVLNTKGYFDDLNAMLRHAAAEGFLPEADLRLYRCFEDPSALLDYLER